MSTPTIPLDLDYITELWLRQKLAESAQIVAIIGYNSSTQRVQLYKETAEQEGSAWPFGIYQNQTRGSTPTVTHNRSLVLSEAQWAIMFEGVDEDEYRLAMANSYAQQLFSFVRHEQTPYGLILESRFESSIDGPTVRVEGGQRVTRRGAVYRIKTQYK